jgi:hypothetical protein
MRPPLRGTMITCLTRWVSPGAVVVANSTRRRISRLDPSGQPGPGGSAVGRYLTHA